MVLQGLLEGLLHIGNILSIFFPPYFSILLHIIGSIKVNHHTINGWPVCVHRQNNVVNVWRQTKCHLTLKRNIKPPQITASLGIINTSLTQVKKEQKVTTRSCFIHYIIPSVYLLPVCADVSNTLLLHVHRDLPPHSVLSSMNLTCFNLGLTACHVFRM